MITQCVTMSLDFVDTVQRDRSVRNYLVSVEGSYFHMRKNIQRGSCCKKLSNLPPLGWLNMVCHRVPARALPRGVESAMQPVPGFYPVFVSSFCTFDFGTRFLPAAKSVLTCWRAVRAPVPTGSAAA